jgi:hypothetical protein
MKFTFVFSHETRFDEMSISGEPLLDWGAHGRQLHDVREIHISDDGTSYQPSWAYMARGGYGLPKVLTGIAMIYPSTTCRQATPEGVASL